MSQVPCARCGDFIESSDALYSDSGELVCGGCNAKAELATGEERAAAAILSASGTSVVFGLAACFVLNPCLAVSAFGVASAVGTFVMLHRNPDYRARLGARAPIAIGVAAFGLVLSLVAPFVMFALRLLTGYSGVL